MSNEPQPKDAMDSHPFAEGPWFCKHCHKPFSVYEDLVKHKAHMRNKNKEDHIHCKMCGRDFHTLEGEMKHMQVEHPLEQNLECPGCGQGPFKRLGALIDHIERGFCNRIDSATLDQLREEKLEFPRRLQELTKEPVTGNYTKYMPSTNARSAISGWHIDEEPASFKLVQEEFPGLADTKGGDTQMAEAASGGKSEPSNANRGDDGNMGTQNVLRLPFRPAINAETAYVAAIEEKASDCFQLPIRLLHPDTLSSSEDVRGHDEETPSPVQPVRAAFWSGVTTVTAGMDPNDPDSPSFNAARYYSVYTNKYNCPKRLCGKTFKTARALVGHLRSPVHGNKSYRCPYCLRIFKSLTGITSHAESRSSKCRIQDTEHYETFMDQLTAGLVDIERTRYQDGSVIFKTSEQVKQKLRGEATVDKTKYPVSTAPDEVYW